MSHNNNQRNNFLRVCVFGSSSKNTNPRYVEEGKRLGEEIAKRGHLCVNGAGHHGCMGGVNEGVEKLHGKVRGIIHEKFCVDFGEHPHIQDLIMCKGSDLSERKQALLDNSDCILVLPGGVGTFDEFWDAVCGKSLGMKGLEKKPIVIVNLDGFYDGFVQQLKRAYRDGILYGKAESYYHVENDPIIALNWCEEIIHAGNLCEKDTKLLVEHIKENNDDRVSVRPSLPVLDSSNSDKTIVIEGVGMDFKKTAATFIVGLLFGIFIQTYFLSNFFLQSL